MESCIYVKRTTSLMDFEHCNATCAPVCRDLCVSALKGSSGHGLKHIIDSSLGFLGIFIFFYFVVNKWHIFYGPVLCASGCIIALFVGREASDFQKIGFWDWEGLLAPCIAYAVLAVVISLGIHYQHWFQKALGCGVDGSTTHCLHTSTPRTASPSCTVLLQNNGKPLTDATTPIFASEVGGNGHWHYPYLTLQR